MKQVMVGGSPVYYRDRGDGIPILVLPGGGEPEDAYFSFQDVLAEKGYRVVLLGLPGLGRTPPKFIPLEGWPQWIDEFGKEVGIGEQFVLISHSMSAGIALRYLTERPTSCLCGVFLNPGILSPKAFWRLVGEAIHYFRLYYIFPRGIWWVGNKKTWHMARSLMNIKKREQPQVPSLVITGKKDLIKYLFPGWRRIRGERKDFPWEHSPQKRRVAELVEVINDFVRRRLL